VQGRGGFVKYRGQDMWEISKLVACVPPTNTCRMRWILAGWVNLGPRNRQLFGVKKASAAKDLENGQQNKWIIRKCLESLQ
jgi:hypothetical protein